MNAIQFYVVLGLLLIVSGFSLYIQQMQGNMINNLLERIASLSSQVNSLSLNCGK